MIGRLAFRIMIWRWKAALWINLSPAGYIISTIFR